MVELATTDMILPAVRYNMGIGFLPEEFAREDLASEKVFEIDVNETFPERSIILIHDTEYPQSIAPRHFRVFNRQKISAQAQIWENRDLKYSKSKQPSGIDQMWIS